MSVARRLLLAAAIALGAVARPAGSAVAQVQTTPVVVQLPFTGDATPDLLDAVYASVRNALLTRGATGPDRSTVHAAIGVSAPTDTQGIVNLGRSMGATHVLTGQVTPLTGQYNLTLRLYEVSSGRVATQQRNIGEGEEARAIPSMLEALFAPGAMQPSPEERARQVEEERRQEEERRRREQERRQEEERRRREQERRLREEEERSRRIYTWAEGGPISLGGALLLGGRVTDVQRMPPAPAPQAFVWGLRIEGGYALLPSLGLEVGGALMLLGSPSNAFTLGPSARIALPTRGPIPLRGSAGVTLGFYQAITGAQTTSVWFSTDLRAEFDLLPALTIFAGASFDGAPGAFASLGGLAGVRVRFGGSLTTDQQAPASEQQR